MTTADKTFMEELGQQVSQTVMTYLDAHWEHRDGYGPFSRLVVQALLESTAGAILGLRSLEPEEQAVATLNFFHAFADDFDDFLIETGARFEFPPAGGSP